MIKNFKIYVTTHQIAALKNIRWSAWPEFPQQVHGHNSIFSFVTEFNFFTCYVESSQCVL